MKLYKKPEFTKKKVIVLLIIIAVITAGCILGNNILTVDRYEFFTKKAGDADGFKIVQISDLHNASFGSDNKRLVEKIKAQYPDIIVITGDIVDSNHTDIQIAIDLCREAVNIAPCYYVSGNHELWLTDEEHEELYSGMTDAGVHILENESIDFDNGITLTGLNDESLYDGTLSALSAEIPDDRLNILLAHEPQYLEEEYAPCQPDLVIAGHAHGGQIRIPFIGGLVAPDQGFFPKYTAGEYKSGNTIMYVSRGLGNSVIPVRVFNTPEINVLIIRQKYPER
ncbi:metallophosphoesterase [uncultured Ruminococcus sp.]|uniref:metallophosphoesterase n=1 Tax=uncultured Ruminococcus sp. TaxID=165186 RepID=UPI0025FE272E|nr:metallophosphoesterase [uncultured Ruminococcus sp.]